MVKLKYIIAVIGLIIAMTFSTVPIKVFAETSGYSDVLADLQKDEAFVASEYVENLTDYSLQVIQIAESEDDELFVYVYQPSGQTKDLRASSIAFSQSVEEPKYEKYSMSYINSNGVFFKYKVDNFSVSYEATRFYDISAIYRKWDSAVDDESGNNNTIDEVAYKVGHLWTLYTVNEDILYTKIDTEVITVTSEYIGELYYSEGFFLSANSYMVSHFLAFSTDFAIEKLFEADLTFNSKEMQQITNPYTGTNITYGDSEPHSITLTDEQIFEYIGDGLFACPYKWPRIQSVAEFKDGEDLLEETENNLSDKQWVLRFWETEYTHTWNTSGYDAFYTTIVSDVSLLRLKFESAGKVYNLGVVANVITGDGLPDNEPEGDNMWEMFISGLVWFLFALVGLIVLFAAIILLVTLLPIVLPLFLNLIIAAGKLLAKVIMLPFRAIASLFKKE